MDGPNSPRRWRAQRALNRQGLFRCALKAVERVKGIDKFAGSEFERPVEAPGGGGPWMGRITLVVGARSAP